MIPIPYIDVHTHLDRIGKDTVRVNNIYPGDPIPAFTGNNFYSVGLHPWEIKSKEEDNNSLVLIEDALDFDHVIFVGECGLDKRSKTDFEEQLRVFKAQAFMAEEFQKPLIIHCVKAWNEVIELHNKNKPTIPWIFHGYTSSPEISKHFFEKQFLFSFGEILFKENSKAIESFRMLPLEKVFFETDEFDCTVEKIYKKGAELKNIPVETLKEAVWENFNRIENVSFNI